jgi:hypothetical protein
MSDYVRLDERTNHSRGHTARHCAGGAPVSRCAARWRRRPACAAPVGPDEPAARCRALYLDDRFAELEEQRLRYLDENHEGDPVRVQWERIRELERQGRAKTSLQRWWVTKLQHAFGRAWRQ